MGGSAVYRWDIIDGILDAYIETGCVPFVELGFMPQALSAAPLGTPYDDLRTGGWRYPPRDYDRWQNLVQALAAHCLERHGLREVSRWYWELWNEPDIFYWAGTVQEYCRLYDHTVAGLVSVLPQARVGGPGTTNPANPKASGFLRAFLDHCAYGANAVTGERGARLDFISFHAKGGGYRQRADALKKTPTIYALVRHVEAGLKIAGSFPELAQREVILSECDPDGWAAGSKYDNVNLQYRNTEYYASYVACTACKMIDLDVGPLRVDGMLTWAFQFEKRGYFEGLRTLSTNNIDKPVLNVFRMLAGLGGMRLHLVSDSARDPLAIEGGDSAQTPPDISGIAATNSSGEVQIFLVSHHDDWDVLTSTQVRVEVTGLELDQRYRLERTVIDGAHSNAHAAWVNMGEPQNPSDQQIGMLKRAAMPETVKETSLPVTGDRCEFTATVAAHSVSLLRLTPTQ